MVKNINSKIGLSKEYPYCIRDGNVYTSTLCAYGKWDRSPLDEEVKAFATKRDAEMFVNEKGFISYEIVIPYKELE